MGAWNGVPFVAPEVDSNTRGGTWMIEILPYIGEEILYSQLFHDKTRTFGGSGSNNPKNAALIAGRGAMVTLICPSSPCDPVTGYVEGPPQTWNDGLIGLCIPSYVGISGADMGYWDGLDLRFKTLKPEVVFNTARGAVATDGVLVCCLASSVIRTNSGAVQSPQTWRKMLFPSSTGKWPTLFILRSSSVKSLSFRMGFSVSQVRRFLL
jgi:hypothetical protein